MKGTHTPRCTLSAEKPTPINTNLVCTPEKTHSEPVLPSRRTAGFLEMLADKSNLTGNNICWTTLCPIYTHPTLTGCAKPVSRFWIITLYFHSLHSQPQLVPSNPAERAGCTAGKTSSLLEERVLVTRWQVQGRAGFSLSWTQQMDGWMDGWKKRCQKGETKGKKILNRCRYDDLNPLPLLCLICPLFLVH